MSARPVPPQQGDEQALFERYERRLRVATRLAVNTSPDIVDDACAFAWMALITHQPRRETVFPYLKTIARNEALRLDGLARALKPIAGELEHDEEHPIGARVPAARHRTAEASQQILELKERLAVLPEREREAVFLSAAGWRYTDVAERLGISTTRVNQLVSRASLRMREMDIAEHVATSPRGKRLQEVEQSPPAYIVASIGSPPANYRRRGGRGDDRREWRRLVLAIEDYRDARGIKDELLPLGDQGPYDPVRETIARHIAEYRGGRGLSLGLNL